MGTARAVAHVVLVTWNFSRESQLAAENNTYRQNAQAKSLGKRAAGLEAGSFKCLSNVYIYRNIYIYRERYTHIYKGIDMYIDKRSVLLLAFGSKSKSFSFVVYFKT